MDTYTLSSAAEAKAYADIAAILRGLPDAQSQYSVLRTIAHDMDRVIVKPGSLQVAAARSAASVGAKLRNPQPKTSTNPKGLKKSVDPRIEDITKKFYLQEVEQKMVARREHLKSLKDGDKTPEILKEISAISLELRNRLKIFRDSQGVPNAGVQAPVPKGEILANPPM